jgi:uncharacterized protein (DUF433 family)
MVLHAKVCGSVGRRRHKNKRLFRGNLNGLFLFGGERYADARSGAMASLDWSQCSAVESVPGKVSGAWVLKGTRMPVSAIFENLEAGANIDNIMEWYDGVDREQVKAVIEFAARSLDNAPACAS